MTLEQFVEAINLPKLAVEKTEEFFRALLGEAITETGGIIADRVRYQRFKNQVLILQKAQILLEAAGLQPKAIPLKTLVPLLEGSSLEEDSNLRDMWARLLADAVCRDNNEILHAIGVQLLSSISGEEAKLLQLIYERFLENKPAKLEEYKKWGIKSSTLYPDSIMFLPSDLFQKLGFDPERGALLLDNLIRLNVVKFELPEIEDGELCCPELIHLTTLGCHLLAVCSFDPDKYSKNI
jgi:hypothetical protein